MSEWPHNHSPLNCKRFRSEESSAIVVSGRCFILKSDFAFEIMNFLWKHLLMRYLSSTHCRMNELETITQVQSILKIGQKQQLKWTLLSYRIIPFTSLTPFLKSKRVFKPYQREKWRQRMMSALNNFSLKNIQSN